MKRIFRYVLLFGDADNMLSVEQHQTVSAARRSAKRDVASDWHHEGDFTLLYRGQLGEDLEFVERSPK